MANGHERDIGRRIIYFRAPDHSSNREGNVLFL